MTDTVVHEGTFLHFCKRGRWEFVRRCNAQAVVAIAAQTDNQEVILIRQIRPVLGDGHQAVIEVPAGLVGDNGIEDSILAAAQRELLEETGYQARTLTEVSVGPSSAGLTDEIITFVTAYDLHKVSAGGGVDGEDIPVFLVAWDNIDTWLQQQAESGVLIDPKVYTALWFLRRNNNA